MNRILIASALVLGVAGAAAAQQAPVYTGNYSPAVADQLASSGSQVVTDGHSVDRMVTASIKAAPTPTSAGDTYIVDRSGR